MNGFLFVILCLSWGSTWIAIKIGVSEVPPLFLAGSRFFVAGLIILFIAALKEGTESLKILRKDWQQLCVVSALIISVCFALIFWGEQFVSASLTAIVVQGMIPIFLPLFAMLLMKDRLSFASCLSILIGCLGLAIVFYPTLDISGIWIGERDVALIYGLLAVVVGTLAYCYGSVLGRNILMKYSAIAIAGWQNVIGGLVILLVSAGLEFSGSGKFNLFNDITGYAVLAWSWLVLVGSVIGFVLYIVLLKSWGPGRVSPYAFATPVVAIAIDYILLGNVISVYEGVGMLTLFIAVWLSLKNPSFNR